MRFYVRNGLLNCLGSVLVSTTVPDTTTPICLLQRAYSIRRTISLFFFFCFFVDVVVVVVWMCGGGEEEE